MIFDCLVTKDENCFPMIPSGAAGVSDRLWEIGDIVKLVEDAEPAPKKRGPHKTRAQISN